MFYRVFPSVSSRLVPAGLPPWASRRGLPVLFALLAVVGVACAEAQPAAEAAQDDPPLRRELITEYTDELPAPSAPPQRRRVLVDRHHETIFHPQSGQHAAQIWLQLMQREGFEVSFLDTAVSAEALSEGDLFILAGLPSEAGLMHTAEDGTETLMLRSPLLREEVEALARWTAEGGAMMVFASHYPNGGGAAPLLEAVGVRFRDGFVSHPDHLSPLGGECSWFTMTGTNGLLRREHPVLAGEVPGLEVEAVRWLCGAGLFRLPQDVLLDLPDGTVNISPREGAEPAREVGDDYAAALAFDYGAGKVFVAGDQGLFRNFLYHSQGIDFHVTISDPEADNDRFLVRLLRWLGQR